MGEMGLHRGTLQKDGPLPGNQNIYYLMSAFESDGNFWRYKFIP